MKHSYFLAGIPLNKLFRLIIRNKGITLYPKYIIRFLFLLQNGIWVFFFSIKEKRKYKKQVCSIPVPDDPLVIIGHWRSGSTFLHQLIALDDNFIAPTVFQVSLPQGFLVSRKYYKLVMSRMIGKKRPMDNVKLGFDEPQEDEYAVLKMTSSSPLENLIFPKDREYFLSKYSDFIPTEEDKWRDFLYEFCKKLIIINGGRKKIVFKNPFHSLRIELLCKMFPNIKFIHIYRNPLDVVPSTIRMWSVVGKQNSMKKGFVPPKVSELAVFMNKYLNKTREYLRGLPDNKYIELKFEDFENDPVKSIKSVYEHFGFKYSKNLENKMNDYLKELGDYRKNKYCLTDNEKEIIESELRDHMIYYNYL